jgi:hypothetical protein
VLDLTGLKTWELRTLIKALHEARFPDDYNDPSIWMSPFVIDLHTAAVEEDHRRTLEKGEPHATVNFDLYISWRGRRDDQQKVLRRMEDDPRVAASILKGGSEGIRAGLRPFVVDDDYISELLDQAAQIVAGAPSGGPGELPT